MRWALLLVMAAGCRQIFGLDSPTTTADARGDGPLPIDGPRDAQGGTCIERWMQGPQFAQAVPLASVNNTGTQDRLPFVTANGLTLYFVRDGDYFTATRADLASPFGSVAKVTTLSSGSGDGKVFVSDDETCAFLSSSRAGGSGGTDIWRGFRQLPSDPWSVDQMFLDQINGNGEQGDPHLSPDLFHLYFMTKGNGPGGGGNHIFYAERAAVNASFGPAAQIPVLAGTQGEDDQPTLTGDERVIVFTSTRGGNFDLYYATRMNKTDPFSAPLPLTALNLSNKIDSAPFITQDGCELYFMSDRNGSFDIYTTALLD